MTEENKIVETNDDYEIEEVLIYAQFDALLDDELFDSGSSVKIIGLESHEPFIQIGNQMYCGKWKDLIGTALFFEEVESPPPNDPVFSDAPAKMLKYQCKTRKGLELSRVFINPKNKTTDSTKPDSVQNDTAKHTQDYLNLEGIHSEEHIAQKMEEQTTDELS